MRVYIDGVGLRGPGLSGWEDSRGVLDRVGVHRSGPVTVPLCALLPPAERRRTVPSVNLALAVGLEAMEHSGRVETGDFELPAVFSSSCGDGVTIHEIIEVLNSSEREVSPIRFHNSVHNAPAGYWSIATRSREPSTSLCCHDASFPAGLLEAAVLSSVEARAVLLVVYDTPYPEPLHAVRPICAPFGVAFVLTHEASPRSLAALDIDLARATEPATPMPDGTLETLRMGNPAARALPLLRALAHATPEPILFDYVAGNQMAVGVARC